MKAFDKSYAQYYDLLYQDKDYANEAQYVHNLLQRHLPGGRSIIEFGCGTGLHAMYLADLDYEVHGIDSSPGMLKVAKSRLREEFRQNKSLSFTHGDFRTIRLGSSFDAVIAIFHVISYQTTNDDLQAAFATAHEHLRKRGVFIFDFWYGPSVLTNLPKIKVKRLEDKNISVTRISEPVIYPNNNLVDVKYQIFITNKDNGNIVTFRETHRLRYLFKPEIDHFLTKAGFKHVECREWMKGGEPGFDTWSVYSVGIK